MLRPATGTKVHRWIEAEPHLFGAIGRLSAAFFTALQMKTPSSGVDDAARAYCFAVSAPQPADVAPQPEAPADVAALIPMLRRIVGARVGGHRQRMQPLQRGRH